MKEKNKNYPELSDLEWIMDLANLNLQGKLKLLHDLMQSVSAFVNNLKLFKEHIEKEDLTHFPTLLKTSGQVTSSSP